MHLHHNPSRSAASAAMLSLLLVALPGYASSASGPSIETNKNCIAITTAKHNETDLHGYEVDVSTREHHSETDEISKRDHARSIGDLKAETKHADEAVKHADRARKRAVEASGHGSKAVQITANTLPAGTTACLTPSGQPGFLPANSTGVISAPIRKAWREVFGK